jgi:hypothetical protein
MAGTISLSLSQQFNAQGAPLAGGRLYFFQAGTTTPQSAYQDSGLIIPHANPIILDAAGRIPQFFLADGSIKIRLDSESGVTQIAADGILVIGPSSGGGGGSPVDATTVLQTGDLKVRYGIGIHTGWVRANGRTVGSATSGATERANADTEALFLYLWGADANLSVSGGRGASAAADWVANKALTLPDWRGRTIAALDDMGASAAGRLGSTHFGAAATTLGAAGGTESKTIAQANLPAVSFTGNTSGSLSVPFEWNSDLGALYQTSGTGLAIRNMGVGFANNGGTTGSLSVTVSSGGSGGGLSAVQPTMLATIYLKL